MNTSKYIVKSNIAIESRNELLIQVNHEMKEALETGNERELKKLIELKFNLLEEIHELETIGYVKKKQSTSLLNKVFTAPIKIFKWVGMPIIQPVKKQAFESTNRIKLLAQPLNPIGLKARIEKKSRHETFAQAQKRLSISDENLQKSYNMFSFMSKFTSVLFLFFVLASLYNLSNNRILIAFEFLIFSTVHLAMAHRFSFRAFQIRNRILGSHAKFITSKNEWYPKKWSVKNGK